MIEGHGDDAINYKAIKINFSSNVYNHVDHSGLHQHRVCFSRWKYPYVLEPGTLFVGKVLGGAVSSFV